jgi:palmitoyl transferase
MNTLTRKYNHPRNGVDALRRVMLPSVLGTLLLLPVTSRAGVISGVQNWADSATQNLSNIYDTGTPDIFVTGYTWHDPATYTAAKRAMLNSHAWGLGWGKHIIDANGNDEMIYAMMFSDSHRNAEPVVGYAKQWLWNPVGQLNFGAGYTAGITSRADIFKNIPFPIALPLVSVGYGRFTLYGTFLPKVTSTLNNGNVAFFFARYTFR